jgi:Family of unknown function (DUF5677)
MSCRDNAVMNRRKFRRARRFALDRALGPLERTWVLFRGGPRWRSRSRVGDAVTIGHQVWPIMQTQLDLGADESAVLAAFKTATTDSSLTILESLNAAAPQMLRDHRSLHRGFTRRLRATHGEALDMMFAAYVVAEEHGAGLQQLNNDPSSYGLGALLGLHARACLVLAEVHSLLAAGLPLGAFGRARSLHETAVIASLLAVSDTHSESRDLGERFTTYAVIDEWKDISRAIEENVSLDEQYVNEVQVARNEAIALYGKEFADDYGWARTLFPDLKEKGRVTFSMIEGLSFQASSRLDYRMASHHVHTSAHTIALNTVLWRGQAVRLTGQTNIRFEQPAEIALRSMIVCSGALAFGQPVPDPMDFVVVETLTRMCEQAIELFDEAAQCVSQREHAAVAVNRSGVRRKLVS